MEIPEELQLAIPGLGEAVSSKSCALRSCMQQFLGWEELCIAIPRLGELSAATPGLGGAVCSNIWAWRSCMSRGLENPARAEILEGEH